MKFVNRWKIKGTLTTQTPLRIGNGGTIKAQERLSSTHIKTDTEINTVASDKDRKPYVPASAIKGSLRSWAKNVLTADEIETIFGSKEPQAANATAGKVQFSNAYLDPNKPIVGFDDLPEWSSDRLTAVSVGIAVDRKTRTASDQKLFHQEYVPPGITFDFSLIGNNYEEDNIKGDEVYKKLLRLLEGFNSKVNPVCLGAETAGLEKSRGKFEWNLTSIEEIDSDALETWLESDADDSWTVFLKEIDTAKKVQLKANAKSIANTVTNQMLNFPLSLNCLGDFLVNDPSKTKRGRDDTSDRPNHSPLRTKDGKPLLPKSSIKGAVRSQSERILRTMAINRGVTDLKKIACYPDDMKQACKPIKHIDEAVNLCLVCQLFGASGWKSPIQFTDFVATKLLAESRRDREFVAIDSHLTASSNQPTVKKREFVAIDRFTGGVSGSGKFNAEVAHKPVLEGELSFDRSGPSEDWAIGLLALTLRDLIEGDIRIGFGRAKGFGEITVDTDLNKIFGKTNQELIDAVKALEEKIGGQANVIS